MAEATIHDARVAIVRQGRGLSQRALAEAAGITRQAVGAIENGRMQPSVGIALALARALGASVEELFGRRGAAREPAERVARATIAGRAVAHRLDRDHLAIEPAESAAPTVFLAGCDLAVGLLARHTAARTREVRVLWLPMTNAAALDALAKRAVHAAVVHGANERRSARDAAVARFELAETEEGWLLARGNPLRVHGARDLSRAKLRLANRPRGSGARQLLDEELRRVALDPRRLVGYDRELDGQLDAGRAIAQGFADAAIGMASVAQSYDLAFVPLRRERCALVIPAAEVRSLEVRVLLDALRSDAYRRDLAALRAYDVVRTGEAIA